ncbi:PspC domain-containing protein [Paenibacillus psychroresistens]|uniref:PspC domain-containing protein n=1 Tax=Paenibacillus psychroresistens TaxID=1778678 RepID=UPI00221E8261|nr:PspC domain-containing protein [Paenibacillus psychroresistens]
MCGGLAEAMNVDATLLRLVVVVTTFFTGGTVLAVYAIASFAIPKEPLHDSGSYGWAEPPMYGAAQQPMSGSVRSSMAYGSYKTPAQAQPRTETFSSSAGSNKIDDMMKDIEEKALRTEVEQLRAKLAQYEKGEK